MPDLQINLTAILAAVGTALLGGLVGYLFSVWKTRLQPIVSLINFTQRANLDTTTVVFKDELFRAARSSYATPDITIRPSLAVAFTLLSSANQWIEDNKSTGELLDDLAEQLKNAEDHADIWAVLEALLNSPVERLLVDALIFHDVDMNKLKLPPYDNLIHQRRLRSYWYNKKERQGCYIFEGNGKWSRLGHGMEDAAHFQEHIKPVAELFARLDKGAICKILRELKPIYEKQLNRIKLIENETQQIVNTYSRWLAEISVTNVGPTPFVIFPTQADLMLSGRHIKTPNLACRVLDDELHTTTGVLLIPPGSTETCYLETIKSQGEIDGGQLLRTAYDAGEASAAVRIYVGGSEFSWWKRPAVSKKLMYQGDLPQRTTTGAPSFAKI